MAFVHGKNTVVKVGTDDLSAYTKTSEYTATADSHDVTTYGNDGHVYAPGLTDGTFTMSGVYDSTATVTPRPVLTALIGAAAATVVRQPEGTGSGKPQDSFSGLLTSYKETNPVDDMIAWSAEFQISGDVTDTAQS